MRLRILLSEISFESVTNYLLSVALEVVSRHFWHDQRLAKFLPLSLIQQKTMLIADQLTSVSDRNLLDLSSHGRAEHIFQVQDTMLASYTRLLRLLLHSTAALLSTLGVAERTIQKHVVQRHGLRGSRLNLLLRSNDSPVWGRAKSILIHHSILIAPTRQVKTRWRSVVGYCPHLKILYQLQSLLRKSVTLTQNTRSYTLAPGTRERHRRKQRVTAAQR